MMIYWNNWQGWLTGSSIFQTSAGDFRLLSGYWLVLLFVLPVLYWIVSGLRRYFRASILFPGTGILADLGIKPAKYPKLITGTLRYLALALVTFAAARPQFGNIERQTFSNGIDIMLVADVSLSMRTPDFFPNRLEASKEVMQKFVSERIGDRIGLTIFATEAAPLVPMTLDYNVVKAFIKKIDFGLVDGNSTAIGMGLATALKKVKESDAKSKIIILLTDGENNAGNIDPLVAAEAAKASSVRVYTIGIGSNSVMTTPFGRQQMPGIDEESLRKIAEITGGSYFLATDNTKLAQVYNQIDKLEKSKVETTQFDNFNELAPWFIYAALLLLFLELLLRSFVWIRLP